MVKEQVQTKELVCIPEGRYKAIFFDVEDVDTEYGKRWRWVFQIPHNNTIVKVSGLSSPTFSRKGKAYKWVCAIAGKEYYEGEVIDTDLIKGQSCEVEIVNKTFRDTEISNVVNVLKAAPAARKKTAKKVKK